jgi:O-antigen/teichoic acid export membrane protein
MTPLSLITPALSLPGLPAIARAASQSRSEARQIAVRLGAAGTGISTAYVLVFGFAPGLLAVIFGEAFDQYGELIWPLGLAQIITASAIGFTLLLKAEQRGRPFFVSRVLTSLAALILPLALATVSQLVGAAWGLAIAALIGTALTIAIATGGRSSHTSDHPKPQPVAGRF